MRRKISEQVRRCSTCRKHLAPWNKSGLCSYHYMYYHHKDNRKNKSGRRNQVKN